MADPCVGDSSAQVIYYLDTNIIDPYTYYIIYNNNIYMPFKKKTCSRMLYALFKKPECRLQNQKNENKTGLQAVQSKCIEW